MPDLVFATKGTAEVLRAQTQMNERAAELSRVYRDDARAARELEQAAGRIFKNAASPAKQFNEEMGRLLGNFKQGKINAQQYEKGVKRLEEVYQETNTVSGKLKANISNMFTGNALKQLSTFAAGFTGAGGVIAAIQLFKSEYQAAIDLINKAATTQMDVGAARNLVIRNLVGETPETIKATLGQTQALAAELNLPEQVISQAFADALSASGGKVPDALNATRLAGQFLADQPADMGEFAGSLIDLQKVTGSPDQRVNFGLLAKIAQLSRVSNAGRIALNAPRGLIGAAGFGFSGQEAAALYSTLTYASGDKLGATSANALIQLSQQLRDFAPASPDAEELLALRGKAMFADPASPQGKLAQEKLRAAEEQQAQAAAFSQLSTGAKLRALQADPALAKQFLANAHVESAAKAPIEGLLLDPRSAAAVSYRSNLASIPQGAGLTRMTDEAIANFRLNELEPVAATSRSLTSLRDQFRVAEQQNLGEEERAALKEILMRLGGSNVGTNLTGFLSQLSDGKLGVSVEETRNLLQAEQERLLRGKTSLISNGPILPGTVHNTPATAEDRQNAKLLGDVIAVLNKQLEAQQETNRKLDREPGIATGGE